MKTLKTTMLLLLVFAALSFGNKPNGTKDERQIVLSGTGLRPHLIDPTATYYISTRMLTIEFPTAGFVPYTLSISSELNTLDYYVTTPLTSVYISPEVVEVDVQLATDGGDLYYGSFEATSNTLSE